MLTTKEDNNEQILPQNINYERMMNTATANTIIEKKWSNEKQVDTVLLVSPSSSSESTGKYWEVSNRSNRQKNNNNSNIPKSAILEPINPQAIMGLLPCDTRNVPAKSPDFPEEVIECCHNFIKGKMQKIDVISNC